MSDSRPAPRAKKPAGEKTRAPRAKKAKNPATAASRSAPRTSDAPAEGRLTAARPPTTSAPRTATRPPDGSRAPTASRQSPASLAATGSQHASTASPPRAAKAPPPVEKLPCPRCGTGTLIAGNRGWGCDRFREGCRFVVWFQTAGKWLTYGQLTELVVRGQTHTGKFAPRGADIEGRLVLDKDAEGGARFEPQ